jgi:hypothetical protein
MRRSNESSLRNGFQTVSGFMYGVGLDPTSNVINTDEWIVIHDVSVLDTDRLPLPKTDLEFS